MGTEMTVTSLSSTTVPSLGCLDRDLSRSSLIVKGHEPPTPALVGQGSQASPVLSPSVSFWSLLGVDGQLSLSLGMVSPSESLGSGWPLQGAVSEASKGQTSQSSPLVSPSASGWALLSILRTGLKVLGQLSLLSATPSPSLSVALALPSYSPGREGTQVGSLSGVLQKNSA